ncbi:MAG: hypothetical protein PW789_10745 [Edaphobacter sp.]|uniref:hypothetical protein n=1 Tax=Edaphobacter sp. TaxID=1934404 RepID=UPI002381DDB3|nr:hypothetical protein [Edaphobacter sp.]MDE1177067.1 hypothetical protein [Edaphobacter sp.]
MSTESGKSAWEQRLHETGARVEDDLRELVRYFNDEVVPEVRKSGSEALRAAAKHLNSIAERMDERAGRTPPRRPEGTPRP